MNKKQFVTSITGILEERMEEGVQVKLQEVRKNNNIVLQGLLIQKPESNISPTIYLDSFYEKYEAGSDLEEIVDAILEIYERGAVKSNLDMEFFRDFEQVKERIVYRLIHAEKNKELLEDIPHILYLDLAICFYYAFHDEELGEGMILVHNTHMEMWNTNHQELMKQAQENTPKLFQPIFVTLDAIMNNICGMDESVKEELKEDDYMYVLTNRQKNQGAACILYPDMLEQTAQKLKGNFYVIPSSIHEVIILRDTGCEDLSVLQEIIKEANKSQVLVEDVLSDHPYYYDKEEKKLVSRKIVY